MSMQSGPYFLIKYIIYCNFQSGKSVIGFLNLCKKNNKLILNLCIGCFVTLSKIEQIQ